MTLKLPKLKRNPWGILQDFNRKVSASGSASNEQVPAWVKAYKAVPPAPKPLPQISKPNNYIQFGANDDKLDFICQKQLESSRHTFTFKFKKEKKSKKPKLITTPPLIVYPEDQLRDLFYSQHPFELDRPRSIAYSIQSENIEWTCIYGSDNIKLELCGESVIQRTLYLYNNIEPGQPRDINIAYKKAVFEFYQARRAQEKKEKEKKEKVYREEYLEKKKGTEGKLPHHSHSHSHSGKGLEKDTDPPLFAFGRYNVANFVNKERKAIPKLDQEAVESSRISAGPRPF